MLQQYQQQQPEKTLNADTQLSSSSWHCSAAINDDDAKTDHDDDPQQQQQQPPAQQHRPRLPWRTSWITFTSISLLVVVAALGIVASNVGSFPSIRRRRAMASKAPNGTTPIESSAVESMSAQQRLPPPRLQQQRQRRLQEEEEESNESSKKKTRILYIITTLSEYNTGTRNTVRGSDRLQETLIPVVTEGVTSMLAAGYHVDVFLVCHWHVQPERLARVRQALPPDVGLDYWNFSTPLGYDTGQKSFTKLENRTLHLARQHRFVIKDKLTDYDMFVCFEDDMLIKADQVNHYRAVTAELQALREVAPTELPPELASLNNGQLTKSFSGTMTKDMLKRIIPGFIRVEVLLDEATYPAQSDTGPVPVDLQFDGPAEKRQVDPSHCCHVSERTVNDHIPALPTADKLMLWETHIFPLGIRQMPTSSWLDWVVLQRGPNQDNIDQTAKIGDYWSNRNLDYWPDKRKRPAPQEFKYINNQGGWMATREQLWEWHTDICPGGFLPPYEPPHYHYDGLDMRNVEWYSGGMQLSTVRHACNLQRVILLEPSNFSKSLLYHSANNKQRQLHGKREESFSKANTLLGQLNALKKKASQELVSSPKQ